MDTNYNFKQEILKSIILILFVIIFKRDQISKLNHITYACERDRQVNCAFSHARYNTPENDLMF